MNVELFVILLSEELLAELNIRVEAKERDSQTDPGRADSIYTPSARRGGCGDGILLLADCPRSLSSDDYRPVAIIEAG